MKARQQTFGERITELRLLMGSQKAVAESFGVSTRTVRRWEKRQDVPNAGQERGSRIKRLTRRRERYWKKEKPGKEIDGPPASIPKPEGPTPRGTIRFNDYLRGEGPGASLFAFDLPRWFDTPQGGDFREDAQEASAVQVDILLFEGELSPGETRIVRRFLQYDTPTQFEGDWFGMLRASYDEIGGQGSGAVLQVR